MAVIPMQKIRLSMLQADVESVLGLLQEIGAMEFHEAVIPGTTTFIRQSADNAILARVQHAVAFLEPYAEKRGLWKTLREGVQVNLSAKMIEQIEAERDVILSVVEDVEQVQVEMAEATNAVREATERVSAYSAWRNLPIALRHLATDRTQTVLASASVNDEGAVLRLTEALTESGLVFYLTSVSDHQIAVTVSQGATERATLERLLVNSGFTLTILPPAETTASEALVAATAETERAKDRLGLVMDQAEHFTTLHLQKLQCASEVLSWQRDRLSVANIGAATTYTVSFDGWLDQTKKTDLEKAFSERNLAVVISEIEPLEGEEPPVEIRNTPMIAPFEIVTRLYGMPGYRDLDPTPFLAAFFFLFFGLSLTDVGYGAFLMVVSVIILTLFTVPKAIRMFAQLLLFVGLSTVLVGMLFGGYLGINPESLPASLRAIQMFDPIGNPLPVFYLALGLGVFQVMVGMLLKMYSEARQGRTWGGILDQGPWFLMFCMAIFYLATDLGYLALLSTEMIVQLIYANIALIVITSGRKGTTILEKLQKSALSLYDSIGYFSDILSYSRLLALGLATTALAFAVNLIAELVLNAVPYVGAIFAAIILIIGHLFTLAVNTLGAFIHSARLQFVEFFGKFIGGVGREFKPLARTYKYIAVSDD